MFRTLIYLLLALFVLTFVRMVAGVLFKGIGNAVHPPRPIAKDQPPAPHVPEGGELKRDPVCGTFVPAATALRSTAHGETAYFCSAECRDKYRG